MLSSACRMGQKHHPEKLQSKKRLTGPVHGDSSMNQSMYSVAHSREFLVVVEDDQSVEVAVANVAKDAGKEAKIIHLFLADLDDVSQAAEGNRNVGAPWVAMLVSPQSFLKTHHQ